MKALALTLVAVAACHGCYRAQAKQAIEASKQCQDDSECIVLGSGSCDFGCYVIVNQAKRAEVLEKMAHSSQPDCVMDCPEPPQVVCRDGRCVER